MGKYKVEVSRTTVRIKAFEVEAPDASDAIDKAEQMAADFDFNQVTGTSEYEGIVVECPEDRNECPDCGGSLKVQVEEGAGKSLEDFKVCEDCGIVIRC